MNDKVVSFDIEELRKSIKEEVEQCIREEVEYEMYYSYFSDLPAWMLTEEFVKLYRGEEFNQLGNLTEFGFALMLNICLKMAEFCRGNLDFVS